VLQLLQDDVQCLALFGISVQLVVVDDHLIRGRLDHLGYLHFRLALHAHRVDRQQFISGLQGSLSCGGRSIEDL